MMFLFCVQRARVVPFQSAVISELRWCLTVTRMKIKYQMISVLKFEGPFIRVFECLQTYQKLTVPTCLLFIDNVGFQVGPII